MGARGPLPQPDNVRELRGNPGKRKPPPKPKHVPAIPNPPTSLKGEALAEWKRVTPELHRMGYLGLIDRAVLVLYCRWWATFVDLDKRISEEGTIVPGKRGGEDVKHPAWQQLRESSEKVRDFAKELGLTPNARLRMVTKNDGEEDDGDID